MFDTMLLYCYNPSILGTWMVSNCRKTCNRCKCNCCSYKVSYLSWSKSNNPYLRGKATNLVRGFSCQSNVESLCVKRALLLQTPSSSLVLYSMMCLTLRRLPWSSDLSTLVLTAVFLTTPLWWQRVTMQRVVCKLTSYLQS